MPRQDLRDHLARVKSLLDSLLTEHGAELRKDPSQDFRGYRLADYSHALREEIRDYLKERAG